MTATNVILTQDAAHLITDGLFTDASGEVKSLGSKCHAFPHIGAAIAVRGPVGMGTAIADSISQIGDNFDAVKEFLGSKLKENFSRPDARALAGVYGPEWNVLDIVVAGWSQKLNRPDAFFIVTHEKHPGIPAWQTIDTGSHMIAPTRQELLAEFEPKITALIAKDAPPILLDSLAADLVDCQSKIESNVGGFAQVTSVSENSISSRVVARYATASREEHGG